MLRTLFAHTAAPTPLPQIPTPRSTFPARTRPARAEPRNRDNHRVAQVMSREIDDLMSRCAQPTEQILL
jgi:hypothetical protein